MFTILGADGKEYGPVPAEQIRAWMAGGRANLDTKAKAAGTDEWHPLGDFPEFRSPGGSVPPPISAPIANAVGGGGELADPGMRLLAWLLDGVFGVLAAAPGGMMIGLSVLLEAVRNPMNAQIEMTPHVMHGLLVLFAGGIVLLVIQVWLLTTRGQSLGKLIFGLRIVNDRTGANPGFLRAVVLRWLVPELITTFIPVFGGFFFLVDSLFVFRSDRRCVHDLIAGTRVVLVKPQAT